MGAAEKTFREQEATLNGLQGELAQTISVCFMPMVCVWMKYTLAANQQWATARERLKELEEQRAAQVRAYFHKIFPSFRCKIARK